MGAYLIVSKSSSLSLSLSGVCLYNMLLLLLLPRVLLESNKFFFFSATNQST